MVVGGPLLFPFLYLWNSGIHNHEEDSYLLFDFFFEALQLTKRLLASQLVQYPPASPNTHHSSYSLEDTGSNVKRNFFDRIPIKLVKIRSIPFGTGPRSTQIGGSEWPNFTFDCRVGNLSEVFPLFSNNPVGRGTTSGPIQAQRSDDDFQLRKILRASIRLSSTGYR
ncbi:hypothetical protein TWF132_000943 [Orbilia oligospora]|nr:hypothetical protein TWF132_000943 [Orbilia oligospora]